MFRSLIFCLTLFLLPACEKLMHPEEISIGKIENYNMLVSAAEGVYGSLVEVMKVKSAYDANLKGDDLNFDQPLYNSFYGQRYNLRDSYIAAEGYCWPGLYKTIGAANNVLSQFVPALSNNEETRKVLGEIYLIRAYCYFRLTRTYGQIPLISDIDINYNVIKASYTEIYNFIESDLRIAMELLPVNNASARIPFVTPHRGTAKAILAEIYLSWAGYPCNDSQKYAMAAKEAGETIDSADYFGLGLLDDFAFVWDSIHYYNLESEFSIYFPFPPQSSLMLDQSWRAHNGLYNGSIDDYGSGGFRLGPRSQVISIGFFCSEVNFFNNYPTSYRKEITFFSNIYVHENINSYTPIPDTGYLHIKQVSGRDRIAYRKFYYRHYENAVYWDENEEEPSYTVFYGTSRIYLFRYAQTILTYSEAMARSGQLNPEAYECVNQIRRRAQGIDINSPSEYDLQPGLSPEAFADSVVWERALEFCGEPEGRWFDLVRLEKVEELPGLRYANEGGPPGVFTKGMYFFRIPKKDAILNPNLGN